MTKWSISKTELSKRFKEALDHANKTEWTIERKRQVFSLKADLDKIRLEKERKSAQRKAKSRRKG